MSVIIYKVISLSVIEFPLGLGYVKLHFKKKCTVICGKQQCLCFWLKKKDFTL